VLTSAFSVEEHRLVNLGEASKNIVSIGSWNKNLEIKESQQFVTQYKKKWNKTPDMFSMLGYETGQLIYDSLL
jgi:ABC-type branched-subunit amino acid transport system substrate-binding protein